ncbi:SCO family protein [Devosia marina]|uniref:Redoxin domain-containing protein n=1 Tax=Devosia marina TaxID=2683198 RepID=A0A7X3FTJ1_9HYPH|nr:SCO family protein [Devosia marina]MVT00397.1 redoxin domain-containing protein [Devosia marina]
MTTNNTLRNFRIVLWVLVAVAAIGATALYAFRPPQRPLGVTGQEFALASTQGGSFTQNDLRGTPSLIFFGYTFCPDVCPTTLAETTAWRAQLGLAPEELRIIFVTVDPERDTPEMVKAYVEGFDPSVIGLVGSVEETERAKAAFGVFSEKSGDVDSEFYLVDHTALTFLIDADGTFQGTIAYEEASDTALGKIERMVKG